MAKNHIDNHRLCHETNVIYHGGVFLQTVLCQTGFRCIERQNPSPFCVLGPCPKIPRCVRKCTLSSNNQSLKKVFLGWRGFNLFSLKISEMMFCLFSQRNGQTWKIHEPWWRPVAVRPPKACSASAHSPARPTRTAVTPTRNAAETDVDDLVWLPFEVLIFKLHHLAFSSKFRFEK